jgi:excisionase family DNA binding protein
MQPSFMSLPDVAAFLDVSPATVYRLVDRGFLTVYRVARRLRFTKQDVMQFLENAKTSAQYASQKN